MRFTTLHDADRAAELGGVGELAVGLSTLDWHYYVDTQDALDAARCIPPVRADPYIRPPMPQLDNWGGLVV